MKRLSLLIALFLLCIPATARALTYYVSAGTTGCSGAGCVLGSDSNSGTLTQPWRHICYATAGSDATTGSPAIGGGQIGGSYGVGATACPQTNTHYLQPGDTLYVRGGTYNEGNISFKGVGTLGSPITVQAFGGEIPIVDPGFPPESNACPTKGVGYTAVLINAGNYVIWNGVNIQNARGGITANPPVTGVQIINSNIGPIDVCDETAAIHFGGSGIVIRNNKLHMDTIPGTAADQNSTGILISYGSNNYDIRNNEVYGSNKCLYYKHGVNVGPGTTAFFNYCHNISGDMLNWEAINGDFEYNVFSGTTGQYAGNFQFFENNCAINYANSNKSNHNTFIEIGTSRGYNYLAGEPQGSCVGQGARLNSIRNVINYQIPTNGYRLLTIWPGGATNGYTEDNTGDYNLYHDATPNTKVVNEFGVDYDLPTWKTHSSQDSHSMDAVPIFTTPGSTASVLDFRQSPLSPAWAKASDGTPIGAFKDGEHMGTYIPGQSKPPSGLYIQ